MGGIAFNPMLKAGYDVKLVSGVITAGGTLGILIPPSVMIIVYAAIAGQSVVKFYGGPATAAVEMRVVHTTQPDNSDCFLVMDVVSLALSFCPPLVVRSSVAREFDATAPHHPSC
jgi:Tripartite ATP-independent periplasmic transporter, DctM component